MKFNTNGCLASMSCDSGDMPAFLLFTMLSQLGWCTKLQWPVQDLANCFWDWCMRYPEMFRLKEKAREQMCECTKFPYKLIQIFGKLRQNITKCLWHRHCKTPCTHSHTPVGTQQDVIALWESLSSVFDFFLIKVKVLIIYLHLFETIDLFKAF